MIDFEAFSDEYGAIKEAAIGRFLGAGGAGLAQMGKSIRTGWKAGAEGAKPGMLEGVWGRVAGASKAFGGKLKEMASTPAGRKRLAGAATLTGGAGLAGYGAYQGGKKLLGGGRSAAPTYVTNYSR